MAVQLKDEISSFVGMVVDVELVEDVVELVDEVDDVLLGVVVELVLVVDVEEVVEEDVVVEPC